MRLDNHAAELVVGVHPVVNRMDDVLLRNAFLVVLR
jgi:hypothetical protein